MQFWSFVCCFSAFVTLIAFYRQGKSKAFNEYLDTTLSVQDQRPLHLHSASLDSNLGSFAHIARRHQEVIPVPNALL